MSVRASIFLLLTCASLAGCGSPAPLPAVLRAGAAEALGVQDPDLDPRAIAAPQPSPSVLPVPAHPDAPPAPVATGNSASLFVGPEETLPAVIGEIDGARRSVYLETFNFGTAYAQRLAPHLIAKAKAGVEVRVLIDYVGSRFLKGYDPLVNDLRKGGVDVQVYKPYAFRDRTGHPSFNIIHRKVYLFDGQRALIGGVNLASPFDTTTQDLLIRWQGPVLQPLYTAFTHDWQRVSKTTLGVPPVTTPAGDVDASVLVTSPGEGREEIRDELTKRVDGAQRSILIENQYLWDDALVARLVAAARRGVSVRVLLPGAEQEQIQRTCNALAMNQLVQAGAEAHVYQGVVATAHLHTKYYAVDDAWAATGSCNGDTRSLSDNQELDVATTTPELIAQLRTRLFERDWTQFSSVYVPSPQSPVAVKVNTLLDLLDYYL